MLARAEIPHGLRIIGRALRVRLEQCVEACFACAKACVAGHAVAADLAARLARCCRACLDCAQACAAARSATATAIDRAALERALRACIAACRDCERRLRQRCQAPDCRQHLSRCAGQCDEVLLAVG
jgi:hypothetical protein